VSVLSLEEINTRTDLSVNVVYQRRNRRVSALKFKIRRIPEAPINTDIQGDLFRPFNDLPPMVSALCNAGLAASDAWDIWQQGVDYIEAADKPEPEAFDAYIRDKIDLLKRRQAQGKVESLPAFCSRLSSTTTPPARLTRLRRSVASRSRLAPRSSGKQIWSGALKRTASRCSGSALASGQGPGRPNSASGLKRCWRAIGRTALCGRYTASTNHSEVAPV